MVLCASGTSPALELLWEPTGLAPKGLCPANPRQEARDWFPGVGGRGAISIGVKQRIHWLQERDDS